MPVSDDGRSCSVFASISGRTVDASPPGGQPEGAVLVGSPSGRWHCRTPSETAAVRMPTSIPAESQGLFEATTNCSASSTPPKPVSSTVESTMARMSASIARRSPSERCATSGGVAGDGEGSASSSSAPKAMRCRSSGCMRVEGLEALEGEEAPWAVGLVGPRSAPYCWPTAPPFSIDSVLSRTPASRALSISIE